jgi:methylmalonyl-CoA mutase, N-terminal domain
MGGMVAAIEEGFPQREVAESAYRAQRAVESGEQIVVGVNAYVDEDASPIPILYIDEHAGETQCARLDDLRRRRDRARVERALQSLRAAASGSANTMVSLLECVRAYATVGEMCDALRGIWGEYEEVAAI